MRRIPDGWGDTPLDQLDLFEVQGSGSIKDPDRQVSLEGLTPEKTYVWQVKSLDKIDSSTTEVTEGPLWTFTTSSSSGAIVDVEPNPVKKGETLRIHGSGFLAGIPIRVKIGNKAATVGTTFGDNVIKHWDDNLIILDMRKAFFKKNGMSRGDTKTVPVKVIVKIGTDLVKYIYKNPELTLQWP
ncbi:MAG: hypothetical protein JRI36_13800 [Deltaproteobacteria bacterium]|nr:hypothetical protein [Deltaproteobacteria bacterium]